MEEISKVVDTYITIEPIMKFKTIFKHWIRRIEPKQVNIGADSGNNNLPEPTKEEILTLINDLEDYEIRVKQKKSLNRLLR